MYGAPGRVSSGSAARVWQTICRTLINATQPGNALRLERRLTLGRHRGVRPWWRGSPEVVGVNVVGSVGVRKEVDAAAGGFGEEIVIGVGVNEGIPNSGAWPPEFHGDAPVRQRVRGIRDGPGDGGQVGETLFGPLGAWFLSHVGWISIASGMPHTSLAGAEALGQS